MEDSQELNKMKNNQELNKLQVETIKSLQSDLESGIIDVATFEAKTKLLNVILTAGEFFFETKSSGNYVMYSTEIPNNNVEI